MADTKPQMEVEQQQEEVVEGVSNAEANEVVEEAYRPAGSDKLSKQSSCLSVSFFLNDKAANKADFHSASVCNIL